MSFLSAFMQREHKLPQLKFELGLPIPFSVLKFMKSNYYKAKFIRTISMKTFIEKVQRSYISMMGK